MKNQKALSRVMNRTIIGAVFFLILNHSALAGVFAELSVNQASEPTVNLAVLTEDVWHVAGFFGQRRYATDDVALVHTYMAGGIGYRWYGDWTGNLLLGLENSGVNQGGQGMGVRYQGAYSQLMLMKFFERHRLDYIFSYSQNSGEIWSRLRASQLLDSGYRLGPEVIVSKFLGHNFEAVGLVVEDQVDSVTIAGKLGVEKVNSNTRGYLGVEMYRSF
ncbi:MAG: hypothetical protein OEW58_12125 [Gammaproteobacteria bacterium]|nr:hypothetical protein [Gammaproteobacteria bacterium]